MSIDRLINVLVTILLIEMMAQRFDVVDGLPSVLAQRFRVPIASRRNAIARHGHDVELDPRAVRVLLAGDLLGLRQHGLDLADVHDHHAAGRSLPVTPDTRAELAYQRDHEMAVLPADYFLRRTRLGLYRPEVLAPPPQKCEELRQYPASAPFYLEG